MLRALRLFQCSPILSKRKVLSLTISYATERDSEQRCQMFCQIYLVLHTIISCIIVCDEIPKKHARRLRNMAKHPVNINKLLHNFMFTLHNALSSFVKFLNGIYTPFISPNSQSLRTELHFQFIRFAAAILQCASVCYHTEHRISAFWKVRFKKRSKIEQKDIITPMHCLAFPSALFGAPFHIDNRTVADCGFWLEYASKTPLEVVADLPHRMRLF